MGTVFCLVCMVMLCQRLSRTSLPYALVRLVWANLESHCTTRAHPSTVLLLTSWLRVETLPLVMVVVVSQFMAPSLPTRTSRSNTQSLISSQWPTLVLTPMAASSSLPLFQPHGSTVSTPYSVKFSRVSTPSPIWKRLVVKVERPVNVLLLLILAASSEQKSLTKIYRTKK